MDKLILSSRLRKQAMFVSLESFKSFLYIKVDKKHQRHALFTRSLICTYVDSSETIINDPNSIDLYDIPPLRNNMTEPLLFEG